MDVQIDTFNTEFHLWQHDLARIRQIQSLFPLCVMNRRGLSQWVLSGCFPFAPLIEQIRVLL